MKRILVIICVCITLVFAGVPMHALTLEEARTLAEENYPLMRDYDLISLTEQYTVENASKAWLPQVQVGIQGTWQTAVATYPEVLTKMLEAQGVEMKGIDRLQYKASVDVRQTIWDGGRISAARNRARAEAAESKASQDVEIYQLRNRVDNLFFGILLLEQQREAIGHSVTLLQANLEKIESLVRNGAAMPSDADAVQVELLSTKQQLSSVQATIDAYRAMLSVYIGKECGDLQVPAEIALPADNNVSERPEMRLMNAKSMLLKAREDEINKSVMPTIGAFAQGFFGYPGLDFMEAMMKRDPSFNAIVGLSATWNLGPLYTRKNSLKLLQAGRERIDVARDVFQFNTDIQATQQRNELKRLRDISASDAEIVALRERVRSAAEARLREGVSEPTELLLRITEEKNARIVANTHHIEYLKALYSLRNILRP